MGAFFRMILVCLLAVLPALKVSCAPASTGHHHLAATQHSGHANHGGAAGLPQTGWCCVAAPSLGEAPPFVTRKLFASTVLYVAAETSREGRSEAPEPGVPRPGVDGA